MRASLYSSQYGVLHDGAKPLPGAVDAVAHLRGANKKLAILSNSSASPEATLERLYSALGFEEGSFDVAVTSGGECSKVSSTRATHKDYDLSSSPLSTGTHLYRDKLTVGSNACWQHFRENLSKPDKATKVLLFTWSGLEAKIKTTQFLSSLGNVQITADPKECDVAIAHGSDLVLGDVDELGGEVLRPLTGLREKCEYGSVDPWLRELSERSVPMYR